MAEFLTTNGTSYHIENIIKRAKKKLILVSPFLQLSDNLLHRLIDAENRGVDIILIYGKAELKKNEEQALSKLKKLNLYYFDNLHAKCYFNEEEMIITSMNIYEYSEKNNREMGVLICRKGDAELFKNAVDETHSILKASKEKPLFKNKKDRADQYNKTAKRSSPRVQKMGVCIRCCTTIDYDPEKPYCYDCYKIWAEYENAEYQERVCHACEKPGPSTMMRPLCNECFKKKLKRLVRRAPY